MRSKAAKFASAMVAGILAAAPLSAPDRAANATECLTGPGQTAPKGQRWHYRIETGTKRHCWYLRDEDEKVTRRAPASDSAAAPAPQSAAPASEAAQRSLEDARAEFPAPLPSTASAAAPVPAVAGPPAAAMSSATPPETVPAAGSTIASRWPSPSDAVAPPAAPPPPASTEPAAATPVANPEPVAQDAAAAASPAVPAAVAERPSVPLQMLFAVIIGALALAGIIASIIVRLGRARRIRLEASRRAAIWDRRLDDAAEPDDAPTSTPPWVEPVIKPAPPRAQAPRPRKPARAAATQERYQKIEEILAQLVRQAQQGDVEPVASDRHLSS